MSNLAYSMLVFCAFLISLVIVSIIKKIYFYVRYKKRFFILPRASIKGIANISMIIAISISIIIMLTVASADLFNVLFRTWPGTRVTLEAILIKIGGLLFGPFLGIFIGAMTDLLTVALTAGVFHYGYLITAMAFGLVSGIIADIFRSQQHKMIWKIVVGTIVLIATSLFIVLFFSIPTKQYTSGTWHMVLFNIEFFIDPIILVIVIIAFILIGIVSLWFIYGAYRIKISKLGFTQNKPEFYKEYNKFSAIVLVIIMCLVCNSLINILILPSFDAELSSIVYEDWIIIRSIIFFPEVVFNCLVIIPIYQIVSKIMNYNYQDDLIEDIKYPLYVD